MTRDELIEAMAKDVWFATWNDPDWPPHSVSEKTEAIDQASAALAALEAARPDIAAVLKGEAVVVPREATDAMMMAGHVGSLERWGQGIGRDEVGRIYLSMIEAAQKEMGR